MKFDDAVMAIRTLLDLRRIAGAHVVDHRQLGEDELREAIIKLKTKYLDAETVRLNLEHALLRIRGLGPWSVNYTLLRGYGYLDGSLHGDVAVQKALQQLLAWNERPAAKATRDWLAEFTPWRALVAAHLWQSLQVQA